MSVLKCETKGNHVYFIFWSLFARQYSCYSFWAWCICISVHVSKIIPVPYNDNPSSMRNGHMWIFRIWLIFHLGVIITPYMFIPWPLLPMLKHWRPDNLARGHLSLSHRSQWNTNYMLWSMQHSHLINWRHSSRTSSTVSVYYIWPSLA